MGNLISAAALIRINTVLRGIPAFLEEKLGKGRTIRKLMGGGGGGGAKYEKKNLRKGKLNEKKIHARQLTLKNIHAMA